MSVLPDALWLNASTSLKSFDLPLLRYLSQQVVIAQWEYLPTQDEASSLDGALILLQDYHKHSDRPVHLLGHGLSGLLGLLYARRHPERVKSLTLLSVGVYPAVDWQAHYYTQRQLLLCHRSMLLAHMVRSLLGPLTRSVTEKVVRILEQDLDSSPSPHSLLHRISLPPGDVPVPLLVCGSRNDIVVDPNARRDWQNWLKPGDRLWECPGGRHFFHYFHPELVGQQILKFWQSLQPSGSLQTNSQFPER